MFLVQILLPLYSNDNTQLPKELYEEVRDELVEQFGGLTAYTQAPAKGLWQESKEHTVQDDVVVYEVMTSSLDTEWWENYRILLEKRFLQDALVIRAHEVQIL